MKSLENIFKIYSVAAKFWHIYEIFAIIQLNLFFISIFFAKKGRQGTVCLPIPRIVRRVSCSVLCILRCKG